MHSRSWALSCAFLLTLVKLAFSSVDTPRITRVGRYLYDENGKRFYIKGVAFQKNGNDQYGNRGESAQAVNTIEKLDPLADFNACKIAIKDFRRLKINTVRVYSYDIEKNHTACMNALERVGIYVIADINPRSANRASQTWDVDLLREYISRIDSLREFPNLLAFNIGNEMIKNSENLEAGPYIKARARDMKMYLKSVNSTALVSYASADGKRFPADLARFLSCNSGGPSAELDLFGVNNYRWCGFSDFQSAYEELTLEFQGSTVAAYFSEFGCLSPGNPRVWTEVPILFSTLMSDLWSGGVAYSYYPTPLGYGLVDYSTKAEGRALRTKDFDNLAQCGSQAKMYFDKFQQLCHYKCTTPSTERRSMQLCGSSRVYMSSQEGRFSSRNCRAFGGYLQGFRGRTWIWRGLCSDFISIKQSKLRAFISLFTNHPTQLCNDPSLYQFGIGSESL
ncbi:hypothetical protein PCASD_16611 [Puccinia coronata f. sp. avenae]|uniref:1,3-beta-glucanosyltransferase n=1 Tax=Puccinia coronata f. sp. avenae TaxID=200324 RepID=A0A2N5T190_9BASI|nr:hypothetical protein PCASD_16611 [Puccinia coronata f. sp. avenae]